MIVQQHGVWWRNSCPTKLISLPDKVTGRMDRSERVEVCYLNFQKTFDSVNREQLEQNAKSFGGRRQDEQLDSAESEGQAFQAKSRRVSIRHRAAVGRSTSGVCIRAIAVLDVCQQ